MSEQKFTNEELAQRVIDGDHEALNILYNQNKGLITKKCKEAYRWCDAPEKADFEELNQEAALSALPKTAITKYALTAVRLTRISTGKYLLQ